MQKKTGKFKKILLALLIAIPVLFGISICINKINSKNLPHRFASAEEGRELLLANTEYFNQLTQNDLDFRMRKSGAEMDEFLDASAQGIKDFNFIEKSYLESRLAKMCKTLKRNGYVLPPTDEIVLIKTDMDLEAGASGYTHGTQIYLNSAVISINAYLHFIPGFGNFFDELLWHEMFHCLTRCNPDFRAQAYSLIHFTVADSDFVMPPDVQRHCISNPDVEHHNAYAAFMIDGQETDCFVAWITPQDYSEAQSDFFSSGVTVLVPIDGTDTYYTQEQASNFDEVFGTNTDYVTDPEECMADNFAYAMLYGIEGRDGQGYPSPEIIQGILDIVSQ